MSTPLTASRPAHSSRRVPSGLYWRGRVICLATLGLALMSVAAAVTLVLAALTLFRAPALLRRGHGQTTCRSHSLVIRGQAGGPWR